MDLIQGGGCVAGFRKVISSVSVPRQGRSSPQQQAVPTSCTHLVFRLPGYILYASRDLQTFPWDLIHQAKFPSQGSTICHAKVWAIALVSSSPQEILFGFSDSLIYFINNYIGVSTFIPLYFPFNAVVPSIHGLTPSPAFLPINTQSYLLLLSKYRLSQRRMEMWYFFFDSWTQDIDWNRITNRSNFATAHVRVLRP